MRSWGDEVFEALVAVVRRPTAASIELVDRAPMDVLAERAVDHRVTGFVVRALRDAGRPVPEPLAGHDALAMALHLSTLRNLARIAGAFTDAGLSWAVVKGPVLAHRWHQHPASRPYDDLDLLVAPGDLRSAVEVLETLGFSHRNRNWSGFRQLGVGEVPLDDGTTVVDLHWHLLGLARQRRDLVLPTDGLLSRARPVHLGSVSVPTLDDADTLVHLCVHGALAGGRRLLILEDVHLVASEVPHHVAVARIRAAGAERLATVVIDRAERLFGPAGSRPLAPQLGAPTWLRASRAIDRAWTTSRPHAWSPFPGAPAAAGRGTWLGTARASVDHGRHAVFARVGLPTVVSKGGPLDWEHRTGDEDERERFFQEVESGDYGR